MLFFPFFFFRQINFHGDFLKFFKSAISISTSQVTSKPPRNKPRPIVMSHRPVHPVRSIHLIYSQ